MFSFRKWLEAVHQRFLGRAGRAARRRYQLPRAATFQPFIERLEVRVLPATVQWTGASADWSVAADWTDQSNSTHHVPGAGDDAVINTAVSVTHNTTAGDTVNSLTVGAAGVASNLTLSSGTLTVFNSSASTAGLVQDLGTGSITLSGGDACQREHRVGDHGECPERHPVRPHGQRRRGHPEHRRRAHGGRIRKPDHQRPGERPGRHQAAIQRCGRCPADRERERYVVPLRVGRR